MGERLERYEARGYAEFPEVLMVVLERRSKTSGMSFARAELSSAADRKGEAKETSRRTGD